jgi:hypothetical protein
MQFVGTTVRVRCSDGMDLHDIHEVLRSLSLARARFERLRMTLPKKSPILPNPQAELPLSYNFW